MIAEITASLSQGGGYFFFVTSKTTVTTPRITRQNWNSSAYVTISIPPFLPKRGNPPSHAGANRLQPFVAAPCPYSTMAVLPSQGKWRLALPHPLSDGVAGRIPLLQLLHFILWKWLSVKKGGDSPPFFTLFFTSRKHPSAVPQQSAHCPLQKTGGAFEPEQPLGPEAGTQFGEIPIGGMVGMNPCHPDV